MTPLDLDCDVAIVGAGPAGCTIAWDLAPTYHVVLLEAAVDGWPRVGESLPPAAVPLLRRLGLEAVLAVDGHVPSYGNRAAWGDVVPRHTRFLFHCTERRVGGSTGQYLIGDCWKLPPPEVPCCYAPPALPWSSL